MLPFSPVNKVHIFTPKFRDETEGGGESFQWASGPGNKSFCCGVSPTWVQLFMGEHGQTVWR